MFHNLNIKLQNIWNHAGFRRYFANTAWLFAEKILRMVVGLFVGVWVARYLGPEKFGLLSYAQSFVALFGAIATLGLDGIVVRELVKDESKRDVLLGTSFVLKLLGAFLVFLVLAIAVRFTKNDTFTNLLIFIIAAGLIFQSFNVIDLYFQSKVLSKFAVWANTVSFLTSSLIKIFLLITKAPLIAFAAVSACDTLIAAMGYIYFYSKYGFGSFRKWKFRFEMAKSLLKDSWPLVFSGIVIMIYMRIDQIMIKNMLGDWAVGQYAAAVRLGEVWYFVPVVICNSLFPAVVRAKRIHKETYYQRLQMLYKLMVYLFLIFAIPITLFSKTLVDILYGKDYKEASNVLTIYVWSGLFVALGVASGKWYLNENLQMLRLLNKTIGATLNIILNYSFIPKYGPIGAAYATVISYGVAAYFMDVVYSSTRDNFYRITKAYNIFQLLKLSEIKACLRS